MFFSSHGLKFTPPPRELEEAIEAVHTPSPLRGTPPTFYPGTWRSDEKIIDEEYKEGIFVGYRWADKNKLKPLFPFGHGLSYTTFEYGKPLLRSEEREERSETTLSISLTNTGSREGTEVVQLYVRDVAASIVRPVKELKGFQRVTLAPGESRTIEFEITRDMLSFYDGEGNEVFEPGEFEIMVGPNASDAALQKVKIRASNHSISL